MISCDKNSLTQAAACFFCTGISEKQLRAVRILLYCNYLNGVTMNCSPETLVNTATLDGYMNMSVKQQMGVETYLLCQIANSGGGGGGGSNNLSGNGSPVGAATPSYIGQSYTDLTTPGFWTSVGLTNTSWLQVA